MIIGHIMGLPVEESVLQLVPAGAAMMTGVWVAGRTSLRRLRHRRPAWLGGTKSQTFLTGRPRDGGGRTGRGRARGVDGELVDHEGGKEQ
jgi:hypothetical protein